MVMAVVDTDTLLETSKQVLIWAENSHFQYEGFMPRKKEKLTDLAPNPFGNWNVCGNKAEVGSLMTWHQLRRCK
jgi:hypothetical protein